jgi:Fungal specific transcription factor domain
LIRHDRERATKAADEFWETAIASLDSVLEQGPLVQLQAIMLLCHYSYANPSVVNSGLCSRTAMALCVQLGLHQEPPAVNVRRLINLESQRRIFWACYLLDAQNNMLAGKPSSVFNVNISVRHPTVKNIQTAHGDKSALSNYLYAFRQLESEFTLGMLYADTCSDSRIAAPEWLHNARARAESWREMLDSHQFASRIEFRYLMYNYQRMRLNRLSPRLPTPSNAMRRECIIAGMFNASEFCRFSRQGSFFYWHHCCWHLFEIGIVLVEGTHTGLDFIWHHQESFLDTTIAIEILRVMRAIPTVLNKMIHRWPQVKQMTLELESLFNPALHRLDQFATGNAIDMESSNDETVARQVSTIRRYLLRGHKSHGWDDVKTSSASCQRQQASTPHNLQSLMKAPMDKDSMTMEEVLHVLQPSRNDGDGIWSQPAAIESTTFDSRIIANPDPHSTVTESPPLLYHTQPSIAGLDGNDLYSGYDAKGNWLSPTGNSLFWHGNGLELDDIFTAFNEGNIY